jgi:hypothetical protein
MDKLDKIAYPSGGLVTLILIVSLFLLAHSLSAYLLAVTLAVQVVEFVRRSKENHNGGYGGARHRNPESRSCLFHHMMRVVVHCGGGKPAAW